jgi:hypothetical protein
VTNIPPEAREYGTTATAEQIFGISRTRQYMLAAKGEIRFIKEGGTKRTLVDFASVRRYLALQPETKINIAA